MQPTITVQLTLDQLETIADALEFTGGVVEDELKDFDAGSAEHEGLTADLEDLTGALEVIADAMDELVGDEEE
jgi:hypothetical protein